MSSRSLSASFDAAPDFGLRAVTRRPPIWLALAVVPALGLSAAAGADGPAPGPLHIIGGPNTGGCIAGAVALPAEGPGFQTIHLDRSAFWGAPQTIAHLELFGREAAAAGLPTLLMEDISRARGGPMPGGHVSHQIGLDADVGLDMQPRPPLSVSQRSTIELRGMVRGGRTRHRPSRMVARGDAVAAHGCRAARRGPHSGQSRDQAAALPGGHRRPVVAAPDPALVRARRPHAYPVSLSVRTTRLRAGASPSTGRRLRCDIAVVVRSVECPTRRVPARQTAAPTGCMQSGFCRAGLIGRHRLRA